MICLISRYYAFLRKNRKVKFELKIAIKNKKMVLKKAIILKFFCRLEFITIYGRVNDSLSNIQQFPSVLA